MDFGGIKYLVFTPELGDTTFVRQAMDSNLTCISILDARSAVYVATGICAQNQKPVAVCVRGDNGSRSAFSGMTEAYYRNLPVVLMTFGRGVDYSVELADVVREHYVAHSEEQAAQYLKKPLPIHIEMDVPLEKKPALPCERIQDMLRESMTQRDYLYLSQKIQKPSGTFRCKVVTGGLPGCSEGALANVLGASLAGTHRRYVGLVTEEEMKHDLNSLGNVNVNDCLMYVVVCPRRNQTLEACAQALGYQVAARQQDALPQKTVAELVEHTGKTILFVYQEDEE